MEERISQPNRRGHEKYRVATSQRPVITFSAIFLAAALFVFIYYFKTLSPILLALLLTMLLALALNPVVHRLRKLLGGRIRATIIVMAVFLLIAGLTSWGVYSPVKKSMGTFFDRLPQYWERIQKPILRLEQQAAFSEQKAKREVTTEITSGKGQTNNPADANASNETATGGNHEGFLRSGLGQVLGVLSTSFQALASNAATVFMVCLTTFVSVIFTLLNPRPIIRGFFSFIPRRNHATALKVLREIILMIPRWAIATLLGMAVIGVMVFAVMIPILGFQDAIVLGLIAFALEGIPYLGPMLALVPALLLAVGKGGWTPLWVLGGYAFIQLIENNLIAPVIVAGRLKLHPVAVIFSILLTVSVFGVLGVILAVPLVAIANILHEELYRPRFLPKVSDEDLDRMANEALQQKSSVVAQRPANR